MSYKTPDDDTKTPLREEHAPGDVVLPEIASYQGPNPFTWSKSPSTCYERFKFLLFTFTGIAPLRFLNFILCTIAVGVFAKLSYMCNCRKPGHGRNVVSGFFFLLVRFFARLKLWWLGFYWIPVSDHRDPKTPTNLLLPNHVSANDVEKIFFDTGCCSAAKIEVFSIPVLGGVLRATDSIAIDRNTPEGRKKAVEDIATRATDFNRPPLCIFPEGTTHTAETLVQFKRGPFVPGVPVTPVCLIFGNRYCDVSYSVQSVLFGTYWQCCQFVNYLRVDYLAPYVPNDAEKQDATLFAANVRQCMYDHMIQYIPNMVMSDHTLSDVKLLMAARKAKNFNMDFVVNDVREQFSLNTAELVKISKMYQVFLRAQRKAQKDKKKKKKKVKRKHDANRGQITLDDFRRHLKTDSSKQGEMEYAERVFSLFDTDKDGTVGMKEFIVVMCLFSDKVSLNERLTVLFQLSDADGDGFVSRGEFGDVFRRAVALSLPPPGVQQMQGSKASTKKDGRDTVLRRASMTRMTQVGTEEHALLEQLMNVLFPSEDARASIVLKETFEEGDADAEENKEPKIDLETFTSRLGELESGMLEQVLQAYSPFSMFDQDEADK